jgi:hypothetical protein
VAALLAEVQALRADRDAARHDAQVWHQRWTDLHVNANISAAITHYEEAKAATLRKDAETDPPVGSGQAGC